MKNLPIGVFDSGVGGLTVVREMLRSLPGESVLYVGDTARVPYGPRGAATISRFALELSHFLLQRQVKALMIACNTVSATARDVVVAASPVPVFDVVRPTVRAACAATYLRRIGVTGTVSTVRSGIYARLAEEALPGVDVTGVECPLFVPIAEENLAEHPVAKLMAGEYLAPLSKAGVDVVILGCTHYPLLRNVIQSVLGEKVRLVDSAAPAVAELAAWLKREGLEADQPARHSFCVTDASYKFLQIANSILDRDVSGAVCEVDLERDLNPRAGEERP